MNLPGVMFGNAPHSENTGNYANRMHALRNLKRADRGDRADPGNRNPSPRRAGALSRPPHTRFAHKGVTMHKHLFAFSAIAALAAARAGRFSSLTHECVPPPG